MKYFDVQTSFRAWHVGETLDISVDGMRIASSAIKEIPPEAAVEILCFPPGVTGLYSKIHDPDPVSITGVVMWRDIKSGTAGIRLNS